MGLLTLPADRATFSRVRTPAFSSPPSTGPKLDFFFLNKNLSHAYESRRGLPYMPKGFASRMIETNGIASATRPPSLSNQISPILHDPAASFLPGEAFPPPPALSDGSSLNPPFTMVHPTVLCALSLWPCRRSAVSHHCDVRSVPYLADSAQGLQLKTLFIK